MSKGINLPKSFIAFDRRVIVFDKSGIPWVVDPEAGSIILASVIVDNQKSAVKKRK